MNTSVKSSFGATEYIKGDTAQRRVEDAPAGAMTGIEGRAFGQLRPHAGVDASGAQELAPRDEAAVAARTARRLPNPQPHSLNVPARDVGMNINNINSRLLSLQD